MSTDNDKVYKVLWTGGYDSTFRICQLAKYDVTIQPYYFYNEERKSKDIEVKTIKKIYEILINKTSTKANILPVIIKDAKEYMNVDKDILKAYKDITKTDIVSPQYKWLSQMSKSIKGLETTVEKTAENQKCFVHWITKFANLEKIGDGDLAQYKFTKDNDKAYYNLFKNFVFPAKIADMTKLDMYEEYKKMNDIDIMKKTWFCQLPINGEPCGFCGPCRTVFEENMEFRVDEKTKRRYKYRIFYLLRHKIKKGIFMIFGKKY